MKTNTTNIMNVPGYTEARDDPTVTADDDWLLVMVIKHTSGDVTLATRLDAATNPNGGISLPTDQPVYLLLSPGTRLYVTPANQSQRISLTTQPLGGLLRVFADWVAGAMVTRLGR